MKRMKRLIATFACAVAVLIWTCAPAQAEFRGVLRSDQDWVINVDNAATGGITGITVYFLGKKPQDFEFTVPIGGRVQYPFEKVGKDVTRIIIEVDSPQGATLTVEVSQNNSVVTNCFGYCHLVFNVE